MNLYLTNFYNSLELLFIFTGILIAGVLFYVSLKSIHEQEYRAFRVSFSLSIISFIPFLLVYFYDFQFKGIVTLIILAILYFLVIALFVPFRYKVKGWNQIPNEKNDERDIMFSRNELKPGTDRYNVYYSNNPDKKVLDEKFREKPGLLSPDSTLYHSYSFASANANLEVIEVLKSIVNGEISKNKINIDNGRITEYIKTWCNKLGAHSIGITEIQDYHLYSYKGRGDLYDKEIKNNHKYAIAITIEMDNEMIQTAPKGPVVMESTQQYLNSGTIALQVAHFIRNLGYDARAHIDGNYEVICPLIARDAGLGEIGRMGLLITPKLGPRVRIAVVTTNLPLIDDNKKYSSSVIDFCSICKKCANACPSRSIPFEDRKNINGVLRWKLDSESCFTYWCSCGTDCGRCIAVCPYSHPNNVMHNFVRWGIHNSYFFRRFALYMDDLFYGRKPKSRKLPSWIDI